MKFTRNGIEIEYHQDFILILWSFSFSFYSYMMKKTFTKLREYWRARGSYEYKHALSLPKLQGLSWEKDILKDWIKAFLPLGYFVVLYDLDLSRRTKDFWAKVPLEKRHHLTKDVVVMKCETEEQAIQIVDSIDPDIGKALLLKDSTLVYWNYDEK